VRILRRKGENEAGVCIEETWMEKEGECGGLIANVMFFGVGGRSLWLMVRKRAARGRGVVYTCWNRLRWVTSGDAPSRQVRQCLDAV
jgi:hypothetical protein